MMWRDVSEEVYKEALVTIFSEPPVDFVYEESFPSEEGDTIFTVEYLPGQFDQRADSAEQCVKLLNEGRRIRLSNRLLPMSFREP